MSIGLINKVDVEYVDKQAYRLRVVYCLSIPSTANWCTIEELIAADDDVVIYAALLALTCQSMKYCSPLRIVAGPL